MGLTKALFEDLEGQVQEAFSKAKFYNKWGQHYLRSLVFAHLLQKRNNFKDFGVQKYGGNLFERYVDKVNNVFDKTPAPTPTSRSHVQHRSACRSQARGRSACSKGVISLAPYAGGGNYAEAKVSMSRYNDRCRPCFGKDSLIQLVDGSQIRCADISAGDVLKSGIRGMPATVRCVVQTTGTEMVAIRFKNMNDLAITPWHPIFVEGKWQFPAELAIKDLGVVEELLVDEVYNFILEESNDDHTIVVNGVVTCTLGHGILGSPVIEHDYYGNMLRIREDFESIDGTRDLC